METHITTMRYAMEIATLSQALAERDVQIQQLRLTVDMQNQQLATVIESAKSLADQNTALIEREKRRAEHLRANGKRKAA